MPPPPSPSASAEEQAATVASASIGLAATSNVSFQDAPTVESMELDYTNGTLVPTELCLEMTSPVIPGPLEMTVVTNIATSIICEAETSSSSDTANAVSECLADIMNSKEAISSQMDEHVG
ncbi:hypothetical protein C0989_007221 [Termitomyces sp. Mn162]|nr:hypothetical protein C0989_007221 [Termitomyces sp. Mn162]